MSGELRVRQARRSSQRWLTSQSHHRSLDLCSSYARAALPVAAGPKLGSVHRIQGIQPTFGPYRIILPRLKRSKRIQKKNRSRPENAKTRRHKWKERSLNSSIIFLMIRILDLLSHVQWLIQEPGAIRSPPGMRVTLAGDHSTILTSNMSSVLGSLSTIFVISSCPSVDIAISSSFFEFKSEFILIDREFINAQK